MYLGQRDRAAADHVWCCVCVNGVKVNMLLAVGGNPRTIVGMLPGEVEMPPGHFNLPSRSSPEQDDDVQDVIQTREYWDSSSKLHYRVLFLFRNSF